MNVTVPQKQNERLLLEMIAPLMLASMAFCLSAVIALQLWLPHAKLPYGFVTPMCVSAQYGHVDIWWNTYLDVTVAQARAPLRNSTCFALPWLPTLPERGSSRILDLGSSP